MTDSIQYEGDTTLNREAGTPTNFSNTWRVKVLGLNTLCKDTIFG
jgi:hypothetical protein